LAWQDNLEETVVDEEFLKHVKKIDYKIKKEKRKRKKYDTLTHCKHSEAITYFENMGKSVKSLIK
jgi:hypothetical protein